MNGGVATRGPTAPTCKQGGVVPGTNEHPSRQELCLGMTLQAEIGIRLVQQVAIGLPVWIVASLTSFPQGLVFKKERPGSFHVTARTCIRRGRPA